MQFKKLLLETGNSVSYTPIKSVFRGQLLTRQQLAKRDGYDSQEVNQVMNGLEYCLDDFDGDLVFETDSGRRFHLYAETGENYGTIEMQMELENPKRVREPLTVRETVRVFLTVAKFIGDIFGRYRKGIDFIYFERYVDETMQGKSMRVATEIFKKIFTDCEIEFNKNGPIFGNIPGGVDIVSGTMGGDRNYKNYPTKSNSVFIYTRKNRNIIVKNLFTN